MLLCQIAFLVCVGVVSADKDVFVSETDVSGIKSENTSIADNVFLQVAECAKDSDCHHLGKCETREGRKWCNCKSGTRGDFCETVDECVDNPVKCGTLKDVSCVFDVVQEKAVCKCDSDSKTYVEDEERCMSPCTDDQCGLNGYCFHEIGDLKFCACVLGVSGDYCEIIDECHNKHVDCGLEPDATCTVNGKGRAYCKCSGNHRGFDYVEKVCKDCAGCGENAVEGCAYRNGIRRCNCKSKFYSNDKGICESCKCPNAYDCIFENGTKICQCLPGYKPKIGVCEKCDCGNGGTNCEFKDGVKVCTCKKGYIQSGKDGICTLMCNATKPCVNGGKCVQNVCNCLKGTSGPMCNTIDNCSGRSPCGEADCLFNVTSLEAYCKCSNSRLVFDNATKKCIAKCNATTPCANGGKCVQNVCKCLKGTSGPMCNTIDGCGGRSKCGEADCLFNVTSLEAYCKCSNSRLVFDDVTKRCRVCDCGSYSRSCSYLQGKKKCNCMDAYEDQMGQCAFCFCKGYISMYGCHFEGARMVCKCLKGYAQKGDECIKCDCGDHGKCTPYGWGLNKYCTCDKGYVESGGMCLECNCGDNGRCYYENGVKKCVCNNGYKEYQGTCKDCNCGSNADCQFDYFGKKKCNCKSGYGMKNGICTACYCDPGTSCTFNDNIYSNNKKECICPAGYINSAGTCKDCDCGIKEANCTDLVFTKCICPKGYEEKPKFYNFGSTCVEIDACSKSSPCPLSTNCIKTTPGNYKCTCKDGYEEISKWHYDINVDGCQDIDECDRDWKPCNDPNAICVNTPGSYKCDCDEGFYGERAGFGYSEKSKSCVSESRPWRTASIVVGCLSAVIIIGLLIGICNKHMSLDDC